MTDSKVGGAAAKTTSTDVHVQTERHHRKLRWLLGAIVVGVVLLAGYVFYPSVRNYAYDTTTATQVWRLQQIEAGKRSAAAAMSTPAIVTTTDLANDSGRASITETTVRKLDVLDEIKKSQQATVEAKKSFADQFAAIKSELAAARAEMVAKLVQPAPAPQTTTPTMGPQTNAAPVQPRQQTAQAAQARNGEPDLVIGRGFHIVTVGDAENQAKMHTCTGHLVVDKRSPKCYVEGGTRFCPNRCER